MKEVEGGDCEDDRINININVKIYKSIYINRPINPSIYLSTTVVAIDSKEPSVPDDASFLAAINTPATVDADDLSIPYSYVTLHNKGPTMKGLPKQLMKGVPILMYTEDVALLL